MTGPRGAGKTTFCELLFSRLTLNEPIAPERVGPPVPRSLGLFSHRASGIEGYDLEIRTNGATSSGGVAPGSRLLPLARRSIKAPASEWSGGNLGPWVFSQNAFERAQKSFEAAFDGLEQGGLFVLDEVGPLELTLRRGYAPLLPRVAALPRFVVVIRPGLIDSLREELARLSGSVQTPGTGRQVMLFEIEPGILEDQNERRRLLREAEEALA